MFTDTISLVAFMSFLIIMLVLTIYTIIDDRKKHLKSKTKKFMVDISKMSKEEAELHVKNVAAKYNTLEPSTNFVHVEPDSHFYTDINHIIRSIEFGTSNEHLLIGLKNTLKNGYNITKVKQ